MTEEEEEEEKGRKGLQQTDTRSEASLLPHSLSRTDNVHKAFSLGILSLGSVQLFWVCCRPKSGTEGTLSGFICFTKYWPNTKIWPTLPKSCPRQVQYLQLRLLQGFIPIQHKLMVLTEMPSSGNKCFSKGLGIERRWLCGLPLYLLHFVPLSFGRKYWFFSFIVLLLR